ncbi:MAG: hypothetical protein Q7S20_11640 [Gemmatimonadaceae bacterium]|nr:hypothetical protein [Gemmatimonadaceae bacterium]
MRLSLRFIVPLLLALAAFAYALVPFVDGLTQQWFVRDVELRSTLVANSVQEQLRDLLRAGNSTRMTQFFTRLTQDERLFAVGFCAPQGRAPVATRSFPAEIKCADLEKFAEPAARQLGTARSSLHVTISPVELDGVSAGSLVLVHDMSFIGRRSAETRKYLFYLFVGLSVVVSLITVVIAQLSWRGWVQGLRALMRGEGLLRPSGKDEPSELRRGDFVFRYVDEDGFGKPQNAFLVCTFWYVSALAALGRRDEARALFETLLACRNRHGLLAEHIDPLTREQWGNFVQTYSMVGLIGCAVRLSMRWDQAF